jgi:hypothetical protein
MAPPKAHHEFVPCLRRERMQESLATTVLVFVMFQGPMVLWLTRQRQRC